MAPEKLSRFLFRSMFTKLFQHIRQKQIASQLRKPGGFAGKKTGRMMNKANAFLYSSIIDIINPKEGNRILEIGFGNGHFFSSFFKREKNIHIEGIDYSSQMVKAAKRNNRAYIEDGKLSIRNSESNNMPFADNSFDSIFCINVIYFWKNPAAHLKEIYRVLKPGGYFYALFRIKDSMQLMPFTKYGFTAYEKEEWMAFLTDNNFTGNTHLLLDEPEVLFKGKSFSIQSHCIAGLKKL